MIKVIKHGRLRSARCSLCDCYFTYEKSDTLHIQTDVNESKRYVECPDCGERIEVKYND